MWLPGWATSDLPPEKVSQQPRDGVHGTVEAASVFPVTWYKIFKISHMLAGSGKY